jgi:glycerol kinase
MEADCAIELSDLRVDGGMVANDVLMQIQADLLGRRVTRPAVTETTALGVAMLAGLAVGVWDSIEQIGTTWQADRTFHPTLDAGERDRRYRGWLRAVERSRAWADE